MEKIFQKIDSNTFKLNQTIKEEPSIIRETVEDIDSEYRVSKSDEDFALNYIRKKLIPSTVKDFNSDVDWQNSLRNIRDLRKVTVEEVSRKLEKTFHTRNIGKRTDHIEYKAKVYDTEKIGWITFKYEIYRDDNDGHLTVKYWQTLASHAFMADLSKIQNLKESQEEKSESDSSISKQEEFQALEFIKQKVIPFAINGWWMGVDQKKQIAKSIRQLQKSNHEKHGESRKSSFSDYIEYKTVVVGVPADFFIVKTKSKEHPEDDEYTYTLTAGFYGPLVNDSSRYSRLYSWPVTYDKNPIRLPRLRESVRLGDISKMEEEEAFNFIKKVVVPKVLSIYNDPNQRRDSSERYGDYEPITAQELNKNLIKTKHDIATHQHRVTPGPSDMIQYTARMPFKKNPNKGPTFDFRVFKDKDGTFISYHHPFKLENWIMRVGRNY